MNKHGSRVSLCIACAMLLAPTFALAAVADQAQTVSKGYDVVANILSTSAILAAIAGIIGIIGKIFKPVREWFIRWIRKSLRISDSNKSVDERFDAINERVALDAENRKKEYAVMTGQNETIAQGLSAVLTSVEEINRKLGIADESNRSLIRDAITKTFYKYCKRQAIPIHEKENMSRLYDVYRKYDGNSYVSGIMHVVEDWEVLSGDDAPSCRAKQ